MDHWAKKISPEMAWKQYLENTMVNGAWRQKRAGAGGKKPLQEGEQEGGEKEEPHLDNSDLMRLVMDHWTKKDIT